MSPRRYGCLTLLIPLAWLLGPAELLARWLGRFWPGSEPLAFLPALVAYGLLYWRRALCPECGMSVFEFGDAPFYWSSPWPRRRCARCGADLTQRVGDGPSGAA